MPHTPPPPHLHTVNLIQYTYSHREEEEGGRKLNQREEERGNTEEYRSQSWVENTNMTEFTQEIGYLQSINSDKQPVAKSLYGKFF
jgi:hypothetical protein